MPRLHLDEMDCSILRTMLTGDDHGWSTKDVTVKALAQELGLHRNTVQRHLTRLERHGTLLPLRLGLSARHLGLCGKRVFHEREGRLPEEALFDIDGVYWVVESPTGVSVTCFAESPARLEARLRTVARTLGAQATALEATHEAHPMPAWSALDCRILIAGLQDPAFSSQRIARRAATSPNTVLRRLAALRSRKAIRMRPSEPLVVSRPALVYARVLFDEQAREAILKEALAVPNYLFRFAAPGSFHLYLHGFFLEDLLRQARSFRAWPGAREVHAREVSSIRLNPQVHEWTATLLRRQMEAH